MGGPPCKTEPTHNSTWKNNTVLWNYLQKGGLTNFIEKIQGFDQDTSIKFAHGWRNRVVEYNNIKVEIFEEIISQVTGLSLDKTKFFNKCVDREVEAKNFLDEGENMEFVTADIKIANHTKAVPLHQGLILLIHHHFSTCPHPNSTPPPTSIPPLPDRKLDIATTSRKRKEIKTKVPLPTSQRVLRSHKYLELTVNLLHISNPMEEPKDVDLLVRVEKMEKEIQDLKSAIRDMDKTKGKQKLKNDEEDDITAEVFKNLLSLDARLGNAKGRNDCILSALKSIYNFIKQHVRSIFSLNGITEDIWGSKENRDLVIAQVDLKDPSQAIAIAFFISLQMIKAKIDRVVK
ncbi:hypothetical protein KI387_012534 [Taxus chinensis]|uniref:Uncharacterized protein n=1 Tax=Taxus chinensis TaxID=29808 RepID=A0AA38CGH9_TAXCH|nr:hypothetical protein KI387_012534 [Taxus chinensis]